MKQRALIFFKDNRKIKSPAFWEIKITPEWFNYIELKNKNHKRGVKEAYIRYLCFLHLDYILSNLKLYQEFRECFQEFKIKKKGKTIIDRKIVCLYWFVAIVNSNKNRIKVVVRKVDWWNKYEFVSVIPIKENWGYSWELYFDEWRKEFFEFSWV